MSRGRRSCCCWTTQLAMTRCGPLLPGTAGCLVLVTSRRRLTALEDAAVITLDPLPPAQAATLLARLAARAGIGAADAAVWELARPGGYLPVATLLLARYTGLVRRVGQDVRSNYQRHARELRGQVSMGRLAHCPKDALTAAVAQCLPGSRLRDSACAVGIRPFYTGPGTRWRRRCASWTTCTARRTTRSGTAPAARAAARSPTISADIARFPIAALSPSVATCQRAPCVCRPLAPPGTSRSCVGSIGGARRRARARTCSPVRRRWCARACASRRSPRWRRPGSREPHCTGRRRTRLG